MSYQKDRDEFIARMAAEGMPLEVSRQLLSKAATLQRLAEAQCNGDWPADNGERPTVQCTECMGGWVPSVLRKGLCPDCRTSARVKALVQALPGFGVILSGDPRGAVVKVTVPSGRTNDWGQNGICVPVRE
jgi:hypothetical protein